MNVFYSRKIAACRLVLLLSAGSLVNAAASQSVATAPAYQTTFRAERWLEDWTWVDHENDDALPLKNLLISERGPVRVSFGGETRMRVESRDTTDFGLTSAGSIEVINLRLLLHSTMHLGERVKLFAQIGSWDQHGRKVPRIFDESRLVLQRGHVEVTLPQGISLRAGRQDLLQTSSRLLIPVDVFNAQLVHDAIALLYQRESQRGRVFAGRRFYADDGIFETRDLGRAELAGAFYERGFSRLPGFDFGLYWWSEWNDFGLFPQRPGPEHRHAFISRVSFRSTDWQASAELGLQRGQVRQNPIEAWAFASEITRNFSVSHAPALTLRVDGASGDRARTASQESWATLHPVMAYLGRGGDYGATNLIGVYPEFSVVPTPGVRLSVGGEWLWRASRAAPFVDPGGQTILPAFAKGSDLILAGAAARLRWQLERQIDVLVEVTWLEARGAFAEMGGTQRLGATMNVLFRF